MTSSATSSPGLLTVHPRADRAPPLTTNIGFLRGGAQMFGWKQETSADPVEFDRARGTAAGRTRPVGRRPSQDRNERPSSRANGMTKAIARSEHRGMSRRQPEDDHG